MEKEYRPMPEDTSDIVLSEEITKLAEKIAENTHDVWAKGRMTEGWSYGEKLDNVKKQNPLLVPYSELSESEKDYDRRTSIETLKLVIKLGFEIKKR